MPMRAFNSTVKRLYMRESWSSERFWQEFQTYTQGDERNIGLLRSTYYSFSAGQAYLLQRNSILSKAIFIVRVWFHLEF